MTAEIIEFGSYHQAPTLRPRRVVSEGDETPPESAEPLTATAKSIRAVRYEAWRKADALTRYWGTLLDFARAASIAKMHGLKEARAQIETSDEACSSIADSHREALRKQILTPAPIVASVNWKRRQLSRESYIRVTKEFIEKAIADDIAFLDVHPNRRSKLKQHRHQ